MLVVSNWLKRASNIKSTNASTKTRAHHQTAPYLSTDCHLWQHCTIFHKLRVPFYTYAQTHHKLQPSCCLGVSPSFSFVTPHPSSKSIQVEFLQVTKYQQQISSMYHKDAMMHWVRTETSQWGRRRWPAGKKWETLARGARARPHLTTHTEISSIQWL